MQNKQTKKTIAFAFQVGLVAVSLLVMILGSIVLYGLTKFDQFLQAAQVSKDHVISLITTTLEGTPPDTIDGKKTFLLLGTDQLDSRGNAPILTDSIVVMSLDINTGKIVMLSIPRDLWSDAYQTKINALYTYGKDRYPSMPEQFPKEVIQEITDVPIQHVVVLSMSDVATLIDLVGGIDVNVPVGFADESFPRSDVDVTVETDPAILYKTVTFEQGLNHFDGERALEYMRSRKSGDNEGTDVARSNRQQHVLTALLNTISAKETLTNPEQLGKLYRFYLDTYSDVLPEQELASLAYTLYKNDAEINLESKQYSFYPDDEQGAIEHPPTSEYDGLWVYRARDHESFKTISRSLLGF